MAGGVYPMDHSMQYGECNFPYWSLVEISPIRSADLAFQSAFRSPSDIHLASWRGLDILEQARFFAIGERLVTALLDHSGVDCLNCPQSPRFWRWLVTLAELGTPELSPTGIPECRHRSY
ncbi:hypothetical protein N7508_005934 [Penicillium antarcticum]|uniref:uncharacterized protein n=1 Tax=Penicillium antarcticum TaxID=416450 RepID=UPI0023A1DE8F|nr:uncharacterized protein N7508_005934 [Penicillium antarcticum]KAJ5306919.1 hypothetical protein N7508_005934 [Penicillium antarcticum]